VQQILNGHVQGGGEAQVGLCGEAELADLVIGDYSLDDVDALGEFALAQASQVAEVSHALAQGQVSLANEREVAGFGLIISGTKVITEGHANRDSDTIYVISFT
jgi:hypothetical protein